MGAAVATALSYMVAFTIRAIDSHKYLKFDLCIPRLVINTALMIAQTVLMLLDLADPVFRILIQLAIVAIFAVYNGREIFRTVTQLAKKFLGKKRKNI